MSPRFLSFHGRILFAALPLFGFAVLAPQGLKGIDAFLQTPLGPGVVALASIGIGMSIEELGTMRRIRQGILMRLSVPFLIGVGAVWALILGAPNASLATFGWLLFLIGFIPTLYIFRHDLAVYKDPRHGQPIALLDIGQKYLRIRTPNDEITIPLRKILGVIPVAGLNGRGVIITVAGKESLKGPISNLPWMAAQVSGDSFVMTEHQLAMNAETFSAAIAAQPPKKARPKEIL